MLIITHGSYSEKDFLSDAQENELLAALNINPWETSIRRRVQHFGYKFNYTTRKVDTVEFPPPIPMFIASVIDRVMATGFLSSRIDQVTVNEYKPGHGIAPHIDTHSAFGDSFAIVSLGSPYVMEFRHAETGQYKALDLPARSLLILTEEGRYPFPLPLPSSPSPSPFIIISKRSIPFSPLYFSTSFILLFLSLSLFPPPRWAPALFLLFENHMHRERLDNGGKLFCSNFIGR